MSDRVSLMFKVMSSLLTYHEFEPSAAEDPPCRGGRRTLNMSRLTRPLVGGAAIGMERRELFNMEERRVVVTLTSTETKWSELNLMYSS
ncbi:hypothetical protein TNCV_425641 [Trichonephila clavipes]|nr:hypothetical protein TNCV_425641 [Trichonephila clavipes]